jgi:hypothetical protein
VSGRPAGGAQIRNMARLVTTQVSGHHLMLMIRASLLADQAP